MNRFRSLNLSWFLNLECFSCIKMCNRGEKTTARIVIEASLKITGVIFAVRGLVELFLDRSPIFYYLASVSAATVITVKILALFVHGPEMKKLSLRATLAESSNESAIQLIFVTIISLWARELTKTGLMSMISSIVMIGKSSAESYLTFGSKNELEEVSVLKHIFLLSTISPPFSLDGFLKPRALLTDP